MENYLYATSQEAQTTLRSILGQAHLDELLSERERLGQVLQEVIDQHTDPWGVKVTQVAVKAVDLPHEMQRAMAKQAESEREKRAKIIHASGELEASKQLTEAAQALHAQPVALHLRYLQTLTEIAAEKNSTIIFPVPIDLHEGASWTGDASSAMDASEPSPTARRRRPHHPRATSRPPACPSCCARCSSSGETGILTFRNGDVTKSIYIHERARASTRPATTPTSGWARCLLVRGQDHRPPVPGGQQADPARAPAGRDPGRAGRPRARGADARGRAPGAEILHGPLHLDPRRLRARDQGAGPGRTWSPSTSPPRTSSWRASARSRSWSQVIRAASATSGPVLVPTGQHRGPATSSTSARRSRRSWPT